MLHHHPCLAPISTDSPNESSLLLLYVSIDVFLVCEQPGIITFLPVTCARTPPRCSRHQLPDFFWTRAFATNYWIAKHYSIIKRRCANTFSQCAVYSWFT